MRQWTTAEVIGLWVAGFLCGAGTATFLLSIGLWATGTCA